MLAFQWIVLPLAGLNSSLVAPARPPLSTADDFQATAWFAQISADLLRSEYCFRELAGEPGVWSAPNRAQELRSRMSRAGLEVFPRLADADGASATWKLALRTTSFGRERRAQALELPSLSVESHRTVLDHGLLHEWFENRAEGLEHGWTVSARLNGDGPLCIGLELCGDLSLHIESGARSAALLDESGSVRARYRDLVVFDAAGRELDARLELMPWGLEIRIDDAGAAYPLTVDPLLTGPAWTAEGGQATAHFGVSVATAGDVNGDGYSDVIVGASDYDNGQTNEGRAFVYLGSSSGLAGTAVWTAESDQSGATFGKSVATAGDVNGDGYSDVIVGAPAYTNGQAGEGRAFTYLGSAGGLALLAAWTAESNQASAHFGTCVAPAGDVNGDGYSDVIVGAPDHNITLSNEGRASVYLGSAAGLAVSAAWTANGQVDSETLGASVASAGDVNGDGYSDVIVGAPFYSNASFENGRALMYLGSSTGLAVSAGWTVLGNLDTGEFGTSVATAGDVNGDGYSDVIVGAVGYDHPQIDEGRAFVYLGSATGLALSASWIAESDQAGAEFGGSVSTAGDVNGDGFGDVIVGASLYDNGQTDEGRAFVYLGSPTGLESIAAWTAESDQALAWLGVSVATAGDVDGDGYSDVIVGASQFDNGQTDEGHAFVYLGSASIPQSSPAWTGVSAQSSAPYGAAMASAGDVNGDGYGDVIVGAPAYDNGEVDEGSAFVYLGSATGLATTAAWMAESDQASASFGAGVASAGDVNGDGYGDVIVGAPLFDNGQTDEGRVFVYLGSASGLAAVAPWTAESNQADSSFGATVATAGDVNGDGFSDVIVGAPQYDNGQTDEGRAFLYLGSAAGLSAIAVWTAESDQAGADLGVSVASAGDVNGDGYGDAIVGAPGYTNGQSAEGRAFVYLGSASGLALAAAWTAESNQSSASFGQCVASAGDVDGNGYSDVIVGAPRYNNGQLEQGRASVYLGSATGLSVSAAWTVNGQLAFESLGTSVASAGDVNGDGYSDVVVGVPFYANGQFDEGRAVVYFGSLAGLATIADWAAEGDQAFAEFGTSVAAAGDVNGDGYGDVMIGSPAFSGGGQVRVHLGNEGRGRTTQLRQQRTDGATPIARLGRSDSETSFRIRAIMLSAFGRTRLQMEQEVKPRGTSFDGTNTVSGNFFDTGAAGLVTFNRLVSGLTAGTQYHWRVRAKYDLTKTPFQRNGPWFTIPTNGWNEADVRTSGSPQLTAYCAGDGTLAPCPCANNGGTGRGCANSGFANGALLAGSGSPSVAADTLVLSANSMTGSVAIFFQGGSQLPATVIDDGLGCVGGPIVRLGTKTTAANASSFPQPGDPLISVRGAIPPAGGVRYYQCFYRNAVAAFCPPATSNRTNGVIVTWVP